MKVTSSPLSLVSYYAYANEKKVPTVYRIDTEKELLEVLMLGTRYNPVLSVVEYKGKPPPNLEVSIFNTVYLCTTDKDLPYWEELNKDWLSIISINPELYKCILDKYSQYFDEDSYDYFWETYKYYPKKMLSELMVLILNSPNRKYTIEDLGVDTSKDVNMLSQVCLQLGSQSNNQTIYSLSESTLRGLFIGSDKKPPYIYYFLVGSPRRPANNPELWLGIEILREAVNDKLITLTIGAVLFNQWVSQLEKIKVNYKKFTYTVNVEQLNKLENILKGI